MSIYSHNDGGLPIGKIVAGLTLVMAIIAGVFWWFAEAENTRQADHLLVLARDDSRLEKYDSALANVNRALKYKQTPAALELKAETLVHLNKVFEADQVYEELVKINPNNPHYYYQIATMALNEEDNLKSVDNLKKAVALEPDNVQYALALGKMLYRSNDIAASEKQFESILKKDPRYKDGWVQYANALSNDGRHADAVRVLKRALQSLPNDSDLYFLLGGAYDWQHNNAETVKAYYKSLELEPMKDSIAAKRYFEITGRHVPLALETLKTDEIKFETKANVMFVDAYLNRKEGRFLVDTGASVSVVYQGKAEHYGLKQSHLKTEVETAGGIIQVPLAIANVQLGRKHKQVVVGILPNPKHMEADGIIGMNFLSEFRMAIDKSSQTITLQD